MKRLFFAAAFAVVAIAGAFATNSKMAGVYYSTNSNTADIDCTSGTISCGPEYGNAWDKPASDPSRQLIPEETLLVEFRQ